MISREHKVVLMFVLAAVTVILSTTTVVLQYLYDSKALEYHSASLRKKLDARLKMTQRQDKEKRSANEKDPRSQQPLRKDQHSVRKSKTIRKSYSVDPEKDLNLRQNRAPNPTSYTVSADAHLGQALRHLEFEADGEHGEYSGNAVPPKLLHSEIGGGRGATGVKYEWEMKTFEDGDNDGGNVETSGGTTQKDDIVEKKSSDGGVGKKNITTRRQKKKRRKGILLKMLKDFLFDARNDGSKISESSSENDKNENDKFQTEKEALFHLEKASEMGNPHAQNMVANILASGILPVTNDPKFRSNTSLNVTSDFSEGGPQLARALMLWHMSAMEGNVEAAMALAYRHRYSAKIGNTLDSSKIITDKDLEISTNYLSEGDNLMASSGGLSHSAQSSGHYGVLGTCETSMAYYEAAADAIMDDLEAGPLRGKVNPAIDQHRLAEIHIRGTSSALAHYNKPDELDEALTYYKMRASTKNQEPDINSAYKLATLYHYGLRGVKQDMKLALKYYTIAADIGNWEAAGQAGKFHLWAMGLEEEERDLQKAFNYFSKGVPGGLDSCKYRLAKNSKNKKKVPEGSDDDDWDDDSSVELSLCDHPSVNGMGLLHVFGVPMMVPINLTLAEEYFTLGKDMGNMDAYYNLAMLRLGWMNPKHGAGLSKGTNKNRKSRKVSKSDVKEALNLLTTSSNMGHIQATFQLAKMYAHGMRVRSDENSPFDTEVVAPSCAKALGLFRLVSNSGTPLARRMRTAYKQYVAGDYDSSLRNYMAAAETGSMDAQVNAAFLLERGYCLGMSHSQCMKASLRMWKAAAQQDNVEAQLRVGDFYYYGDVPDERSNDDDNRSKKPTNIYSISTFPLIRYIIYPEDLLQLLRESISSFLQWTRTKKENKSNHVNSGPEQDTRCQRDDGGVCLNPDSESFLSYDGSSEQNHHSMAAKYYRKAAEQHSSARANFNLGFMYEWGLGLKQDFPLAKRHYDLASSSKSQEAVLVVNIALACMNLHEKSIKFGFSLEKYWNEIKEAYGSEPAQSSSGDEQRKGPTSVFQVLMMHFLSWESGLIIVLSSALKTLMIMRQNERRRH